MNWRQFSTLVWLRLRLTRNQLSRGGVFNAVIATIISILAIIIAIAAGVGGCFLGAFTMANAQPRVLMLTWDGIVVVFLFFWMVGVLVEMQRSEAIDLARLLHMPVSLEGVFVMNYLASHVTMAIIIFLPAAVGLCFGLIFGKGMMMALLLPLVLSFVFMVTAWTYCLRGWLVTLMVNPRKRRNVLAVMTLTFVLVGQAPNIYFQLTFRHQQARVQAEAQENMRQAMERMKARQAHQPFEENPQPQSSRSHDLVPAAFVTAHNYVPFLWLGKGASGLAEGKVWPAILGALGGFVLGVVGLARAYRTTLRFYLGQGNSGATVKIAKTGTVAPAGKIFLERKLPLLPEAVTAMALGFFRSMMRAPEVKMGLFSNVVILIAVVPIVFMNAFRAPGETAKLFYMTGAVAFTFLGLLMQMLNLFGFDRDGFRALVLSPVRRRDIFVAKNLALAPMALLIGLMMMGVVVMVLHPPPLVVVAGLFQLTALFMLLSMAGNWVSIWAPFRVSAGSMKPTKPPAKIVLMILLTQLLFPISMVPILFPPALALLAWLICGWSMPLVDAALSLGLVGLAAGAYWMSLDELGLMLEGREQKILQIVSHAGE